VADGVEVHEWCGAAVSWRIRRCVDGGTWICWRQAWWCVANLVCCAKDTDLWWRDGDDDGTMVAERCCGGRHQRLTMVGYCWMKVRRVWGKKMMMIWHYFIGQIL